MTLKDATRRAVLEMYAKQGIASVKPKAEMLIQQCERMKIDAQQRSEVKGELAEVVLECYLSELQKKVSPSVVSKGLCIVNRQTGLTTELDLTFFTPGKIYMFECKSYSGVKTLTDKCFLHGQFTDKDVHGQSVHHMGILHQYLQGYQVNSDIHGASPYKLVLFELSSMSCRDERDQHWKTVVPYVTLDTLDSWISAEFNQATKVNWDIPRMVPLLNRLDASSAENFEAHLKRLRSYK